MANIQVPKGITSIAELLDAIKVKLEISTDAQLAEVFAIRPTTISNLRHQRLNFGDSFILRAHEITGWPVASIRTILSACE